VAQRSLLLTSAPRLALRPTKHLIQWILGVLSREIKSSWGVMLITHPHTVPRSRTSRSYTSFISASYSTLIIERSTKNFSRGTTFKLFLIWILFLGADTINMLSCTIEYRHLYIQITFYICEFGVPFI
jgi:hypothetical protein